MPEAVVDSTLEGVVADIDPVAEVGSDRKPWYHLIRFGNKRLSKREGAHGEC